LEILIKLLGIMMEVKSLFGKWTCFTDGFLGGFAGEGCGLGFGSGGWIMGFLESLGG
jgi:hypothetical protein